MSSGEKIIASIRQESNDRIAEINADADKIYQETISKAEKQAQEIRHIGEHKVQLQSEKLLAAYKSKEELEKRNIILRTKRAEIEKAIDHIYNYMIGMKDKEYFELILKLARSLGNCSGTVFFNSRDLARLPSDIKDKFNRCGVNADISDKPDDSIDSGFILKNGPIEQNMSFLSVINDKREQIEDIIGRELFRD